MEIGRYQEAGLVLCRAGHLELALSAFESSLDWKQAVVMATQLHFNKQQMTGLANKLARKRFQSKLVLMLTLTIMKINWN